MTPRLLLACCIGLAVAAGAALPATAHGAGAQGARTSSARMPRPPFDETTKVTFRSVGGAMFGAPEAELRRAWGMDMADDGAEVEDCRYLTPKPSAEALMLLFMVDGGRFVRMDVYDPRLRAPGGGYFGMTLDDLRRAYPKGEASPHHYEDGAQYFTVADPTSADHALVFEVARDGTVDTWRLGLRPQVTYVEGCA